MSDYLQLPFPKNALLPVTFPAVVHGHEVPHRSLHRSLYVLRDGRDVMVSLYFYLAAADPRLLPRRLLREFPNKFIPAAVRENLPRFIDYQAEYPTSAPLNWGQHVTESLACAGALAHTPVLRYERLLDDGITELSSAIATLTGTDAEQSRVAATLEKFSFKKQSGRARGQEAVGDFLRSGVAGQWRIHFTREAAAAFDKHFGKALRIAGYEQSSSWIEELHEA